ncbi:biopolymer transporter ExbD [Candidatus Fermentibacteria bacterium]|nr:biopolymer transporter ExbD [Candidatus Fermentibacteria bacterium]
MIRSRHQRFSTINVTNLVDVTMTLLVVFMLTGPVMHRSTDIRPPSSDQGRIIERLDPGIALVIEVDSLGNLRAAGEPVPMAELADLASAARAAGRTEAYLRADRSVRYEAVASALTELRRGGYESVGLVQEARRTEQP